MYKFPVKQFSLFKWLVFWFFQKRLHPVPSFFVTPFRFCLFRICVILWVLGLVFLSLLLFNWNLVWIPVVSTIQLNQSLVFLFSKKCLFSLSQTNATLYRVCLQDLYQAVESVQEGRYMLTVKTPKLSTLKLKLSLTSISTIFLVCSLFLISTLHSSCFTQTSKKSKSFTLGKTPAIDRRGEHC